MNEISSEIAKTKIGEILEEVVSTMGISGEISPDSYLGQDLGIDSLGLVTIAAKLSTEFQVELPEDLLEDALFMTVKEVIDACVLAINPQRA